MKTDMLFFRVSGVAALLATVAVVSWSGNYIQHEPAILKKSFSAAKHQDSVILFAEDFDSDQPFARVHNLETGPEYALTYVAAPGNGRGKAARFELHKTDPLVKGGKRAEVTVTPATTDKE